MDSDDHEKITNTLAFWTIFLWKEDRKKVVLKQQQQQPTEMRKKKIQHSKWEDIATNEHPQYRAHILNINTSQQTTINMKFLIILPLFVAVAFTAPLYPAIPGEPCLTDPAPAIAYNAYPQPWNHQAVVPQFDYNFVAPSQVSASAFAVVPSVQYGYASAQYVAAPAYPSYVQAAPQFQQYVSPFPVASPYVHAVPIEAAAPTVEAPVVTTVVEVVPLPEPVPFVPEPVPTTPAPTTPAPTTELTVPPLRNHD
uniref:Uncharacterized protein n=1 Tax=Daphnia galeata TaxID=27404 RepID=A0A8J2WGZ1_9CRUS|nr:unnamed protein product [Daphnia galeata]